LISEIQPDPRWGGGKKSNNFVVHVLERFFDKDHETAYGIMMHANQHGKGECGVYAYEVAQTKVTRTMDFARKHQHPLQGVMERKPPA
jgi:ATP-dependent Clp protease adaptor protein ClpS